MENMTIAELATNYGTLDLLTAYIMRATGVEEEIASDWVYDIDFDIERRLDEMREDEAECEEEDDEE